MTDDQPPPRTAGGSPDPSAPPVHQKVIARYASRALAPLPPTARLVVVLVICVALVIAPLLLLVLTR